MTTRKTKKKVLDITKGNEVEVEVDETAQDKLIRKMREMHGLDMQEPVDPNPETARNVPVDELINNEYPGLLRDRDQSQILIAILKELVRARRAHD